MKQITLKKQLLFFVISIIMPSICCAVEQPSRNPFDFSYQRDAVKELAQNMVNNDEQVNVVQTETKWDIRTITPTSVIVQHKDDGQIREITLPDKK